MLYCFECNNVFHNLSGLKAGDYCPLKGCDNIIEDIDENYLPIIQILNEKGYITTYCCSGHFCTWYSTAYISFGHIVKKELLSDLPSDFIIEENQDEDGKFIVIRAKYNIDDQRERHKRILELTLSLLNWAINLPELERFICLFVEVDKIKAQKLKKRLKSDFGFDVTVLDGSNGKKTISVMTIHPKSNYEKMRKEMIRLAEENNCKHLIKKREINI